LENVLKHVELPSVSQLISKLPATPRPDLDKIFQGGSQGFFGADGDYSFDIGGGRSLWLFGDTIVSPGDKRDPDNYLMPRNTIGIIEHGVNGDFKVKYYWNQRRRKASAFFREVRSGEWVWPGSGCMVDGKAYFFLNRFQTNKNSGHEQFNFTNAGLHFLRAENPEADPNDWEVVPVNIPRLAKSVYWGNPIHPSDDGFLYVFGSSLGRRQEGTLLARCPFEFLEDNQKGSWEYLKSTYPDPVWIRDPKVLEPVFEDRSPEMSISYLKKQKYYVAVYGVHGVYDSDTKTPETIRIRIAEKLTGPWSKPESIYIPPEPGWSEKYFCYAPKAHPELYPDGDELLITYITNSYDIADVFTDNRIYYPRFLSLPLISG
jgi:uncharacterized protein DUF4185